jgi:hypothetical protein
MDEIINAEIESTSLGLEDHSIMTAWLHLTWDGAGQGFGGFCLKSDAMYVFVNGVIEAVGVDNWEDLKGKYIRIHRTDAGFGGKIDGIGHIVENKWFYPTEAFEDYKKTLNDEGELE